MELIIGFVIGVALGFVLERGQFCLASAFRDFYLFRHTSMLKALTLSIIITAAGFLVVNSFGVKYSIKPLGLNTLIGGIVFGIGMILAGGCASGTLYRVGEGYITSLVALFGMLLGIAMYAEVYPWFNAILIKPTNLGRITLQSLLGISVVYSFILLSALLLLLLAYLKRYSK